MERNHLRELRHDFRCHYGVRYEDVDPEEAVDLAFTLPRGSLLVSALHPELSWSPEREAMADLQDTLYAVFGHPDVHVTRPRDVVERRRAHERARKVQQTIENTKWEAVD